MVEFASLRFFCAVEASRVPFAQKLAGKRNSGARSRSAKWKVAGEAFDETVHETARCAVWTH